MRNAGRGTVDEFVEKWGPPFQRLVKGRRRRRNKGWRPEMGAIRLAGMILAEVLDDCGADQSPEIAVMTTFGETDKRKNANNVHRIDIRAHRYRARSAPAIPIFIKGAVMGRQVRRK